MAKKSFIKGIGNILGSNSDTEEKHRKVEGTRVLKKQSEKAAGKRITKKSKALARPKNPVNQIKVIELKDRLTVDQSHALKEQIMSAYENSRGIKLIADKCDIIDLSAVQLFYSLYKTAQKEQKETEIKILLNKEQTSLLRNAGLYYEAFAGENKNQLSINHNN